MIRFIAIALFLLLAGTLVANPLKTKVDGYVGTYVKTSDFSGCVLIRIKSKNAYLNCFGKANVAFGIENSPDTKFKIGSISKQFTAAAILKLEEKGLLKTSDPVAKHLPKYQQAQNITIHHLLTHTSGLIDIYSLPNFREINRKSLSLEEVTDEIFKTKPVSEPGKAYAYSNSGYTVLARIIEKVGKKPYGQFLEENIFAPLKMNSSGDFFDNAVVPLLAVGYDPKGYMGFLIPDYVNDVFVRGSGSLYSTVGDIAIWIDAIKKGRILSEESLTKLLTNHNNSYGYGISVYSSFGKKVFGHDGRISGYIGDYLHYREDDVSVVVLGNVQTGVADFLRRDIAAIVFGKDYKSKAKTIPGRDGYPSNSSLLPGRYQFGPGFAVFIEDLNGILKARANEGSYSELIPLNDGRYFIRMLYAYLEFEFDAKGKPVKLVWFNNDGNRFVGQKVKSDTK